MITLRNKIAQMLIMGFHGVDIHEKSPVTQWLLNESLGGVILFDKDLPSGLQGKNLINQNQIKHLTSKLQHYSLIGANQEQQLPLLIAIDYEGGAVDRLRYIDDCMPTMKAVDLAKLKESDYREEIKQMALNLTALGFNLNFAPVVDLNLNEQQGIIGKLGRSFSANPNVVSQLAQQFVELFSQMGIACCYKHFPGHGSAVGDTHEGYVDVSETFEEEELIPYQYLSQAANQPLMVMTAHVVNRALDPSGYTKVSAGVHSNSVRPHAVPAGTVISNKGLSLRISETVTVTL